MMLRCSILILSLGLLACGPSGEEVAGRAAAREAVTALRAQLDERDRAAREAMTLEGAAVGPCDPAQVRLAADRFAEWNTEHLDRAHLASTNAIRARLREATELLDDDREPFRWANAARLIEEVRGSAESPSGHDVVMLAQMEPVVLAMDGTFTGGRTHGRIFGWDAAGQRVVCSSDFDHTLPNTLHVGGGDLRSAQVYGARTAAFLASGFGEQTGESFGVPSL